MDVLALMTGVDIPIPECQLILHQPKIKEIAMIGEKEFFQGVQLLTIDKTIFNDIPQEQLNTITDFQIFSEILQSQEAESYKDLVLNTLSILFPNMKILFLPNSVIFSKDGNQFTIDENNFKFFQESIKAVFCLGKTNKKNFQPVGKKAAEIARKLEKARERTKKTEGSGSFASFLSSLSIAANIPLTILENYTVFQLQDSLERYSMYIAWDIDIKARLAGAPGEKEIENWMKDIY